MLNVLTFEEIKQRLDDCLEVEFSFYNTDEVTESLLQLLPEQGHFIVEQAERLASTNKEIAFRFVKQAPRLLKRLDTETLRQWGLFATDCYDRSGLHEALLVMDDIDGFEKRKHEHEFGAVFEQRERLLSTFLQGLHGRRLNLKEAKIAWTDSETIYLPSIESRLASREDNFKLYKASAVYLWAQVRFNTFDQDLPALLTEFSDQKQALAWLALFEQIRLDACIKRTLPGLAREMRYLKQQNPPIAFDLTPYQSLTQRQSTVLDSLSFVVQVQNQSCPPPCCYQGIFNLTETFAIKEQRIEREKAVLRVRMAELMEELQSQVPEQERPEKFELKPQTESETELTRFELTLEDKPIAPPEDVANLLSSIMLDLSEIPDEYLHPAGDGEYDLKQYDEDKNDPDNVWAGTYHEEGAFFYHEWDFKRAAHRKNWCVVREVNVKPLDDQFYQKTLEKYQGAVISLRRTFEILRGENKQLKRQTAGEDIDLDALVEAWADVKAGQEMTDRLFTHMHKEERSIGVILMVDMSGSTKGWINDAERESLVLLCEALETLGDRYAIYGFSGKSRKRCDIYKIKTFEEPLNELVKQRIGGIEPDEYTRMGFAIRHLSALLQQIDCKIKLLITLSDGKPEDYDGYYRGEYGVEDTRQALYESRRDGIHPFCITIDSAGKDYLPHMYGSASYAVIDEVASLPLKVSDIYRKLTS